MALAFDYYSKNNPYLGYYAQTSNTLICDGESAETVTVLPETSRYRIINIGPGLIWLKIVTPENEEQQVTSDDGDYDYVVNIGEMLELNRYDNLQSGFSVIGQSGTQAIISQY